MHVTLFPSILGRVFFRPHLFFPGGDLTAALFFPADFVGALSRFLLRE